MIINPDHKFRGRSLVGMHFGKLIVLSYAGLGTDPSGLTHDYWNCRCHCGRTTVVQGSNLKRKDRPVKSCGCERAKQGALIREIYDFVKRLKLEGKNANRSKL